VRSRASEGHLPGTGRWCGLRRATDARDPLDRPGYSRQRREKTMSERLPYELDRRQQRIGAAMKRKEDLQKMAESNKAFAHYRW
jgi:hypothetical protein